MKCLLCNNAKLFLITKIKNKNIFECRKCKLAITNNKNFTKRIIQEIYNFDQYKLSEKRFRIRIRRLVRIILKFKNKGDLLDIGAGFGLFSLFLSELGRFNINIVEPLLPLKYLKNKKIRHFKCNVESFFKKDKHKYDLITLIDVLEHFNNPLINLNKLASRLRKNGYIVIQVPNYKSLMAKICKNWAWWMIEDHRFHFSPRSIRLLLEKTGYKIKFITTYEDLYDFKKNLDGNFVNIKVPFLKKFVKALFYFSFFSFYFLFRQFIWSLGYGGLIFIIAKREN